MNENIQTLHMTESCHVVIPHQITNFQNRSTSLSLKTFGQNNLGANIENFNFSLGLFSSSHLLTSHITSLQSQNSSISLILTVYTLTH